MHNEILLIPDKEDRERDALAEVWQRKGGEVLRIGKFWIKPEVGDKRVSIYGYDSFCLVLAQVLGLEMVMVKDEWIAALSYPYLKRKVDISSIADAERILYPMFIKPVTPKLFKAEIFQSAAHLKTKVEDVNRDEQLICSEVIDVKKEVRSFILNKEIKDLAYYEGEDNIEEARNFIEGFLSDTSLDLPVTFVLDIGYNDTDGWFVIEFNSSWGAGLNFCSPEKVIDCIRAATKHDK